MCKTFRLVCSAFDHCYCLNKTWSVAYLIPCRIVVMGVMIYCCIDYIMGLKNNVKNWVRGGCQSTIQTFQNLSEIWHRMFRSMKTCGYFFQFYNRNVQQQSGAIIHILRCGIKQVLQDRQVQSKILYIAYNNNYI